MQTVKKASVDRRRFLALVAAALGLTLATGVVYGRWTHRWGPPADLQAAAKQLEEFPRQIGDWKLSEETPLADAIIQTLECAGYVNRVYVHQSTGQLIRLAVIVGPPGPTAVHTPEICYSSRAYEISKSREKAIMGPPGASANSFWKTTLKSRNVGAEQLQVYYGWSIGDNWQASRSPRFEFGGNPLLYKIQLAGEIGDLSNRELADPCRDFLDALLRTHWAPDDSRRPTTNTELAQ